MNKNQTYLPGNHPNLPPPPGTVGFAAWIKNNLFSDVKNTILTILCMYLLFSFVNAAIGWFVLDSVVFAESKRDCLKINDGACWAVISKRVGQFFYGFYPVEERWRPNLCFIMMFFAVMPLLYDKVIYRKQLLYFSLSFPFLTYILLTGGVFGIEPVDTSKFGGFMLTVIIGVTGIAVSLPIGVLLSLGRQSNLFAVRILSIFFIEFMRGVPLITLLFVASTMLNYFLPPGTSFDLLMRVLIMVTLFSAAYIAEVVRGGIQAIPKGQYEAAQALGLSYWQTTRFITLPQALKISIPGIVNTFIGLYKDTTLVVIIGLMDPLGIGRAALADSKWNGLSREVYLFISLFYFFSCFAMSRYSLWLEKKLSTEQK